MRWPPSVLRIRVTGRTQRGFRLCIPFIALWPVALALMTALSPVAVLLGVALPSGKGRAVLLAGPVLFAAFCALRGLHVHVQGAESEVLVSFA